MNYRQKWGMILTILILYKINNFNEINNINHINLTFTIVLTFYINF